MATSQPNTHSTNSHAFQDSNHKKRLKIGHHAADHHSLNLIPWRSHTEHQIYSSKLLHALRYVLRRSPSSPANKPAAAARQVRHTADRVLAAAAKGRTRWSRAILAAPRWKHLQRQQHKKVKKTTTGFNKAVTGAGRRRLPALQRKARVLSRLVPGCWKVSFPNLLEEATDYISALEMQVRAMTALTQLLAGGVAPAGVGAGMLS